MEDRNNEDVNVQAVVHILSADKPAACKATLQKNPGGYDACPSCDIHGVPVPDQATVEALKLGQARDAGVMIIPLQTLSQSTYPRSLLCQLPETRKKTTIYYPSTSCASDLISAPTFRTDAKQREGIAHWHLDGCCPDSNSAASRIAMAPPSFQDEAAQTTGLHGRSVLCDLPEFDLVHGVVFEALHDIFLGFCRTLGRFILGQERTAILETSPTGKPVMLTEKHTFQGIVSSLQPSGAHRPRQWLTFRGIPWMKWHSSW